MGCGASSSGGSSVAPLPEADPKLMNTLSRARSKKSAAVELESAITVLAVVRPLLDFEKKKNGKGVVVADVDRGIITCPQAKQNNSALPENKDSLKPHEFQFSGVFEGNQKDSKRLFDMVSGLPGVGAYVAGDSFVGSHSLGGRKTTWGQGGASWYPWVGGRRWAVVQGTQQGVVAPPPRRLGGSRASAQAREPTSEEHLAPLPDPTPPYLCPPPCCAQFVSPLLDKFAQGFNATVFAYGQTGSGKTYTMGTSGDYNMELGVVPLAFRSVFQRRPKLEETHNIIIKATFVEVYRGEAISEGWGCSGLQAMAARDGPEPSSNRNKLIWLEDQGSNSSPDCR